MAAAAAALLLPAPALSSINPVMGAEIYDPRLYIDPGPRDRRYLTGQDQHRSRSIWNNNPESLIPISHRGTCRLPRWHPRLHPYLERAGLHNLRHFMRLDIDNDLLTAMAERWRPELHTFHFPEIVIQLLVSMFELSLKKMKLGSKKGVWKAMMPIRLRSKSATRFCVFPKSRTTPSYGQGKSPVYLNVYDLTPMNGYVYWAGLGIFHSGVEVHGVEYAFGAHDYPTSGVFEVEPRQCPGFKFRRSILVGTTSLDPMQVREFMEQHAASYHGDTYHLIVKNCNHFCKDVCYKLTGRPIPKWVNRLAQIGSVCNCVLPESLKINAVTHDPNGELPYDSEKRRLRSAFSCLSSISMRQRQLSTSSLILQSPLRGCLPWEFKRSVSTSLKER